MWNVCKVLKALESTAAVMKHCTLTSYRFNLMLGKKGEGRCQGQRRNEEGNGRQTEIFKDGCRDVFQPTFSSTVWPHSWGEDYSSTLLNPRGPVTTVTSRLQQTGQSDSSTHSLSLPGSFCFLPLGTFITGGIRCHIRSPVTLTLSFREKAQSSHVKRLCGEVVPAIPDMRLKIPSYTQSLVETPTSQPLLAIAWDTLGEKGPAQPRPLMELWNMIMNYFRALGSRVTY